MNRRDFLEVLAGSIVATQMPMAATSQIPRPGAAVGVAENRYRAPVRVNPLLVHPQELRLKLDGEWKFLLDPHDIGIKEGWHKNPAGFSDTVQVPGCWQGQGHGSDGLDHVWDFQLETRTLRATYKGTGWYAKRFDAPSSWRGKQVFLNFGGVHPSAEVWLNGTRLGENDMPFVPFGFNVTDVLRFDITNSVIVRVHEKNRIFGLAFNFQGNWSGLYRGVDLTATGFNSFRQFYLYPDLDRRQLGVRVHIENEITIPLSLEVAITSPSQDKKTTIHTFVMTHAEQEFVIDMDSPTPWSPTAPNLYRVDAVLKRESTVLDALSERTGFVTLSSDGPHFLINGEPYFMRGTGDFALCPETGSPDTDRQQWRQKLKQLRAYGYNYVRCQSYLYPPEYLDVADEVGLLVQSEMGILGAWGGVSQYHGYQWPKPTPDNYPLLKNQWDLSVRRDVNHVSANIYCMSNESGAGTEFGHLAWQCYADTKTLKPTAAVIWTDGGYNADLPADFINSEAKSEGSLVLPPLERLNKPLIQHEFRWWSSFPDVRLIKHYDGAVRPYAALIALEAARQQGQEHLLGQFAESSNRLQFIESKGKMEMRRGDFAQLAGICHFNAMDTNPSPQGILNEFYEKKIADAETWLQTNGDTVILGGIDFDDRVWEPRSTKTCVLRVSDFSHPPFQDPVLEWKLEQKHGEAYASGRLQWKHQPFCLCDVGEIHIPVPEVSRPVSARLTVRLVEGERTVSNEWSIWIYPKQEPVLHDIANYGAPQLSWLKSWTAIPSISKAQGDVRSFPSLILSEYLDTTLVDHIRQGGNVLLVGTEAIVRSHPVSHFPANRYFFTPPANYPPYSDGQNGTIINPHPILDDFEHEGFADLNFYRMIQNAPPIDLTGFELNDHDPMMRVIHRYPVCYPLAYLLERRIGTGRLLICALELAGQWPEARYLLHSIYDYVRSKNTVAASELTERQLTLLMNVFEHRKSNRAG